MQFSLMQFGANAARGQVALGRLGDGMSDSEDEPGPIAIDLAGNAAQERARDFLYSAAELLMVSISGCAPKSKK
jgi:hypothetical protein